MLPALDQQLGAPEHRLRGELQGSAAGEADFDARVGQGLDDQEQVGGAAAGETGDGVELRLLEQDGEAHAVEDGARGGEIGVGRVLPEGERGRGGAHCRGRVGHGAHDAHRRMQPPFDGLDGHASGHADDQLVARDVGGDPAQDLIEDLRLDAEHDDVALARDFGIGAAAHSVGCHQLLHALGPARADEDLPGLCRLRVQQALEQRLAHVAGADEPELLVRDHATRSSTTLSR